MREGLVRLLVLTDDGLRAALEIHRARPQTAIAVLSPHVQLATPPNC